MKLVVVAFFAVLAVGSVSANPLDLGLGNVLDDVIGPSGLISGLLDGLLGDLVGKLGNVLNISDLGCLVSDLLNGVVKVVEQLLGGLCGDDLLGPVIDCLGNLDINIGSLLKCLEGAIDLESAVLAVNNIICELEKLIVKILAVVRFLQISGTVDAILNQLRKIVITLICGVQKALECTLELAGPCSPLTELLTFVKQLADKILVASKNGVKNLITQLEGLVATIRRYLVRHNILCNALPKLLL